MIPLIALAGIAMMNPQPQFEVKDLAWFAGSWECSAFGGTFEEHWSSPSGGSLVGMGKLVAGGETQFMEFMSIEKNGTDIHMWMVLDAPSKGDKKPMPFKLKSLKDKVAVFENPKNDFPSKITYKMRADGNLWCQIEGLQGGKAAKEDFDFLRVKK